MVRRRLQLQHHRISHHPGKGGQRMGLQGQGEQRRHGRHPAMAQGLGDPQPAGVAAGGEHQAIGLQRSTAPQA